MKTNKILFSFLRSFAVVLISVLLVATVVYAATTIGSNITTEGTLAVTDTATLSSTLAVTGATTLSSTLGVTGSSTLSSVAMNHATTSMYLSIGDTSIDNLNYAGGDLYVAGAAEIDGTLYGAIAQFSGNTTVSGDLIGAGGTIDLASSTATTTAGIFSRDVSATSTISVGSQSAGVAGCLEVVGADDSYYACSVVIQGDTASTTLKCAKGRCK